MSTFRGTIQSLIGQDIYLMNYGTPLKGKIVQINGDMVIIDPEPPQITYKIVLHIDSVMLAIA